MTKQLGPTFGDEFLAAGLGGLPITWKDTDDSITGRDKITPEQNTTLDGVVAAHDPTKKPKNTIATTDFIARFTNQEYIALNRQRAADTTASKVGFSKNWDIVVTNDAVNLNQQKVQRIKDDLVAAGVLTQARADEIFS